MKRKARVAPLRVTALLIPLHVRMHVLANILHVSLIVNSLQLFRFPYANGLLLFDTPDSDFLFKSDISERVSDKTF